MLQRQASGSLVTRRATVAAETRPHGVVERAREATLVSSSPRAACCPQRVYALPPSAATQTANETDLSSNEKGHLQPLDRISRRRKVRGCDLRADYPAVAMLI